MFPIMSVCLLTGGPHMTITHDALDLNILSNHESDEKNKSNQCLYKWQTSPEDQNRGTSGPTKRTDVLQFFLKR